MRQDTVDKTYGNVILNIQCQIESDFDSIKNFCEQHKIDRFNLSKIFNQHRIMSVGLFIRINIALGNISAKLSNQYNVKSELSLKKYLGIDNNLVLSTIIELDF